LERSLRIDGQVPTFRTGASHEAHAASLPATTRPVNRLLPSSSQAESEHPGFDDVYAFRQFVSGSLAFVFLART
jgi:hypothetical protein